jgi:hypothetical protein
LRVWFPSPDGHLHLENPRFRWYDPVQEGSVAIHLLNRSSLNHSVDEPFTKILFYSVVAHYVVFYFLFGNPFLISMNGGGGGGGAGPDIDVELLSPSQVQTGSEENPRILEGDFSDFPRNKERDFPAFPPEEGSDEPVQASASGNADPASVSEEGIKTIETLEPVQPAPPKKVARKLPRNMTGPEDCMLKVVAMVCPEGDAQCIAEYREFCTSLPD